MKNSSRISNNDITGDSLVSRSTTDKYREGWDRIFGNRDKDEPIQEYQQAEKEGHQSLKEKEHHQP